MFAGYREPSTSGGGDGRDNEGNRENEGTSRYGSFTNKDKREIEQKRREEEKKKKGARELANLKSVLSSKTIIHADDDDDDDDDIPGERVAEVSMDAVELLGGRSLPNSRRNVISERPVDAPTTSIARSRHSSESSDDRGHSKKKKKHKKKEHKHKKKRSHHRSRSRRRHRSSSRSSSPSPKRRRSSSRDRRREVPRLSLASKNEKWSFLKRYDHSEGDFIVYYRQLDRELARDYDRTPTAERVTMPDRVRTSIVNAPKRLSKVFYPLEKTTAVIRQDEGRYFVNLTFSDNPEALFEAKAPFLEHPTDFIALSQERYKPFQFKHEIKEEADQKAAEAKMKKELSGEEDLDAKKRNLSQELDKYPKSVELWLQRLVLEDKIYARDKIEKSNRKALVDTKVSILEKAIKANPKCAQLRREKLDLMLEQSDAETIINEWKSLLNTFPNSCELWQSYLDTIQYDARMFKARRMEAAFDDCLNKLTALLDGSFRSHKPEPNTRDFYIATFTRRMRYWIEHGDVKNAVSALQASLEMFYRNPFGSPLSGCDRNERDRRINDFERFWQSGLPRIGDTLQEDQDLCGGYRYYQEVRSKYGETVPQMARRLEFEEREREDQSDIAILKDRKYYHYNSNMRTLVLLERAIEDLKYRPRRIDPVLMDDVEDRDRMVDFDPKFVCVFFQEIDFFALLSVFGVNIPFSGPCSTPSSTIHASVPSTSDGLSALRGVESTYVWQLIARIFRYKASRCVDIDGILFYYNYSIDAQLTFLERHQSEDKSSMMTKVKDVAKNLDDVKYIQEQPLFGLVLYYLAFKRASRLVSFEKNDKERKGKKGKRRKIPAQDLKSNFQAILDVVTRLETLRNEFLNGLLDSCVGRQKLTLIFAVLLEQCKLDPSFNERRILITAFIYRLEWNKVTPPNYIAATNFIKDITLKLSSLNENDRETFAGTIDLPVMLSASLLITLQYAIRRDVHDTKWMAEVFDTVQRTCALIKRNEMRRTETLLLTVSEIMIDFLKYNKTREVRSNFSEMFVTMLRLCPHSLALRKRYVEFISCGVVSVLYRKNLELIAGQTASQLDKVIVALSKIEYEHQVHKRVQKNHEQTATTKRLSRWRFARAIAAEASTLRDTYLWRLAISVLIPGEDERVINEIYILAQAQAQWAKQVHLDRMLTTDDDQTALDSLQLMYEAEVTMLIDEEQIGTLRQAALENTTTATPSNANRGPATVASDTAVVKEEVMSPTRPEPPTDDLSLEDVGGEENGVSSDDIEGKLSVTAQGNRREDLLEEEQKPNRDQMSDVQMRVSNEDKVSLKAAVDEDVKASEKEQLAQKSRNMMSMLRDRQREEEEKVSTRGNRRYDALGEEY